MRWAGNAFAPVVPLQEAVDGALMQGVAKLGLQGALDLSGCGDLPLSGTIEERGEKSLFFRERAVVVAASSFARRVERSGSEAVVGGDNEMHRGNGDSTVERNAASETWFNEGVIDNAPVPALRLVGSRDHPGCHSLEGQVGSSTR